MSFHNHVRDKEYKAAIVLSLHSGKDFLSYIYEILKDEGEGNVEKKDKAYLLDRLLVLNGKEQIYGTQFKESSNGSKELFPIQDPEHLEERRGEVGLD